MFCRCWLFPVHSAKLIAALSLILMQRSAERGKTVSRRRSQEGCGGEAHPTERRAQALGALGTGNKRAACRVSSLIVTAS